MIRALVNQEKPKVRIKLINDMHEQLKYLKQIKWELLWYLKKMEGVKKQDYPSMQVKISTKKIILENI